MTKLSINETVKRFQVSRPTVFKHLKQGKISGAKVAGKGWQIDASELSRVYDARQIDSDNLFTDSLPTIDGALTNDLRAEIARLQAELAVADALAEERGKRLDRMDQLMLSVVPIKRRWWPW